MKTNIANKQAAQHNKKYAGSCGGGKTCLLGLHKQGGFTLIEMLVVVGIISVLTATSIPIVNSSVKKAQEATDAANERAAKSAAMTQYLLTEKMSEEEPTDTNGYLFYDNAAGKWKAAAPSATYGKCKEHNHQGHYLKGKMSASGELELIWTNGTTDEQRLCSAALMADSSGGGGGSLPTQSKKEVCGALTVEGTNFKWDPTARVLTIEDGADVTIYGNGNPTRDRIVVQQGASADIKLNNVNIDTSGLDDIAAFMIADGSTGKVTVRLIGENKLQSGRNCAGLQKNGDADEIGTLTITGSGSLVAIGGENAAGIGGDPCRNIEIDEGKVEAIGGGEGAGIGSACHNSSDITIKNNSKVTAIGGTGAAGIGGGSLQGNGSNITISGSYVTVVGNKGDDIGGGENGSGTAIKVNSDPSFSSKKDTTTYITPTGYEQVASSQTYGAFTVRGPLKDKVDYASNVLTIKDGARVTISNTNSASTTDRIMVEKNADITLAGVNIDVSSMSNTAAFKIADDSTGNVTIILGGGLSNTLKSGTRCAGLEKNGDGTGIGKLTITGTGSLTAEGDDLGAGIGGGNSKASSNIYINGGTVTATGDGGAGIGGGGDGGNSGYIYISGGIVTATGNGGAGIGSGHSSGDKGHHIYISGGTVVASGGSAGYSGVGGGAGIGGGTYADGEDIYITGGEVTATGGTDGGAGIGGGHSATGSNIHISNSTVTATGGRYDTYVAEDIGNGTGKTTGSLRDDITVNGKNYTPKTDGSTTTITSATKIDSDGQITTTP